MFGIRNRSGMIDAVDMPDVLRARRARLGLSQADLARAAGLTVRQVARYEAGEQQPVLSVAARLADALDISINQLAGMDSDEVTLAGEWWYAGEAFKEGVARVDYVELTITQRGERLLIDAQRARSVEDGSYAWRGELRLWDQEALMGWYRSTEDAVRSKGTLYLALHPHGTKAWGRWVGMSYDGLVISGWAGLARDRQEAGDIVTELIDSGRLDTWNL